jgi:hypothetical protein
VRAPRLSVDPRRPCLVSGAPPAPATGADLGAIVDARAATSAPQEEPRPRSAGDRMGRACEVCGNVYDKPIELIQNGTSHVFDCFECAIHALAPECAHCGCRIVGHGMESEGQMFCCAHCAQSRGVEGLRDRS